MKKQILTTISMGVSLFAFSAFAQNIDTGYEANPTNYFTATGIDENGSHDLAQGEMRSNANRACGYVKMAQQISPTRFRTVYTYLHASAEFKCATETDSAVPDRSLPRRRCWYFDDSNPNCFAKTSSFNRIISNESILDTLAYVAHPDSDFLVKKSISVPLWSATSDLLEVLKNAALTEAEDVCSNQRLKARQVTAYKISHSYAGGLYRALASARFICE